jgi:hypothetical protein
VLLTDKLPFMPYLHKDSFYHDQTIFILRSKDRMYLKGVAVISQPLPNEFHITAIATLQLRGEGRFLIEYMIHHIDNNTQESYKDKVVIYVESDITCTSFYRKVWFKTNLKKPVNSETETQSMFRNLKIDINDTMEVHTNTINNVQKRLRNGRKRTISKYPKLAPKLAPERSSALLALSEYDSETDDGAKSDIQNWITK